MDLTEPHKATINVGACKIRGHSIPKEGQRPDAERLAFDFGEKVFRLFISHLTFAKDSLEFCPGTHRVVTAKIDTPCQS